MHTTPVPRFVRRCRAAALLGALALSSALVPALAGPSQPHEIYQLLEQEKGVNNVYRAYFPDAQLARKAAITFHENLLESNYSAGYLVMELDARDMDRLRAFGFRFEQAPDFLARRNEFLSQMQAAQLQRSAQTSASAAAATIPNFACYETVEETFAQMQAFADSKPTLASVVNAGVSWEKSQGLGGYDIKVLKLTNTAIAGPKPILFVQSAIHAREYTTAPLTLEFARWLVNGYGNNADATWILDHHEVHLMLHVNPDGRKKAETGLSWRKNTNNNFCANTNTRGIDLNRNFSFTWNSTAGAGSSGDACNLTYRGPSAGSEPETQAVQSYVRSLWPDRRGPLATDAAPADTSGIHLDIHSYSQLVLWPWGTTSTPAPNGTALQTLGRRLAFFNGYTPEQSIGLYATDGTSDAVSYGELGVAAFTIELGSSFFESCSSYESTTKPNNLPALIYAAKVVRAPYLTPGGPDITSLSLSNDASVGGVLQGTLVTLSASSTDTRFNNSNGTEPTQAIAAAEVYVDVPPWQAGAVAIPLSATDGAFNSSTEALTGSINTTGLALGKHLLYVRARDAGGTWGPVSAVFVNVTNVPPPLVAAFSSSCTNLSCSFNGGASTGSPTSYQWNFGDGASGSGVSTSRSYAAAGSYNVTLTVSNGSSSASQTQTVTVVAAPVAVAEVENNNSTGQSQLISANPALISGTIGNGSDVDYYRVSLGAGKTLTATLTPNSSSNYNLDLYSASGTLIGRSSNGTGQVDTLKTTNSGASAITIYARVNRSSGGTGATNGRYTLRLQQ